MYPLKTIFIDKVNRPKSMYLNIMFRVLEEGGVNSRVSARVCARTWLPIRTSLRDLMYNVIPEIRPKLLEVD